MRKDNQDSGYAGEHLLVIADGVGGAARGDIASSTAVQILRRLDDTPSDDLLEALAGAIHRAHDRIAELVEEDPELEGTSTTVTVALFDGNRIGVGHVGDSRGYLLRDGELSQLTKDHTFVQSLIDEGRITEEEARTHPHRNLILRAVDGVHETDPDLFMLELAPGDRILLCSDGASGVLDNDRLADILGTGTVDYAVVELVQASLDAGSTDNITCVVADVVDAAAAAATRRPRRPPRPARCSWARPPSSPAGPAPPPRASSAATAAVTPARWSRSRAPSRSTPRSCATRPGPPPVHLAAPGRGPARPARAAVLRLDGRLRLDQKQYYVAVSDSKVAIFRGIQADLPGLTLSRLHSTSRVTLESLPDTARSRSATASAPTTSTTPGGSWRTSTSWPGCAPRRPRRRPPAPSPPARATGSDRRPSGGASDEPTASPTDRSTAGASQAPEPSPSASPSPTLAPRLRGGHPMSSVNPLRGSPTGAAAVPSCSS